jgi:hypothetical protein
VAHQVKEQLEQNIKAYSFKLERRLSAKFFKTDSQSTGRKEMSCPGINLII